jgi:5-(carboxyamino)imidazole ribonucleotide synthase
VIRVGIIGAGQLGQMLGQAAQSLDIECIFLDPAEDPPAQSVGTVMRCAFDDSRGIRELASRVDVLTYEFENVPVSAIESIATEIDVFPPPAALHYAQDRLVEKQLFVSLGIPVAAFRKIDSLPDLRGAAEELGLPLVLKTRRLGYDGKGQVVIHSNDELATAWQELGSVALIAEQMIDFDYEVSAIGARNVSGDIVDYPLTENRHDNGILQTSRAPAGNAELTQLAHTYHTKLATELHYVGILAVEFFVVGQQLIANEFAPRVHNSGHWTQDGAITSQFENHLRAILDMPLGDPSVRGFVAMENLIGSLPANMASISEAGFHTHEYGKAARPGRKLGHITLLADSAAEREQRRQQLLEIMST